MIDVCQDFERRLDAVWGKLQRILIERHEGISQYDCDELAVEFIERSIDKEERSLKSIEYYNEQDRKS